MSGLVECQATFYATDFCNLFEIDVCLAATQHGEQPPFVRYALILLYQLQRQLHQWNMARSPGFLSRGMYPPDTVFSLLYILGCQIAEITE